MLCMIVKDGHEVASHGYSHEVDQAFDVLPFIKQVEHLKKSKQLLEDVSGQEVISFRAPALRVNSDTPKALAETGYRIDSSIASQRFDMFLSFGGIKNCDGLLHRDCRISLNRIICFVRAMVLFSKYPLLHCCSLMSVLPCVCFRGLPACSADC